MSRYPRANPYSRRRAPKVKLDRSPISEEEGRKILASLKDVPKKKSEEKEV